MTASAQPLTFRSRWQALAKRPLRDPMQRRLYPLLFYTLLALAGIDLLGLLVTLLLPPHRWSDTATLYCLIIGLALAGIALAVNDRFQVAVALTAIGLLVIQTLGLAQVGMVGGATLLASMLTSVVLAGLMLHWRMTIAILLGNFAAVGLIAVLADTHTGLTFSAATLRLAVTFNAFVYICLAVFIAIIVCVFRLALEKELGVTLAREAEITIARDSLQSQVEAQTAELRAALAERTTRTEQLTQTLDALERSQATVQQLNMPLIPVAVGVMLVPLVGAINAEYSHAATDRILTAVERNRVRTLILDLSSLITLDEHDVEALLQVAHASRLMGAEVVLVGIGPEVAQHMVTLRSVEMTTYASLEQAIARILARPMAVTWR